MDVMLTIAAVSFVGLTLEFLRECRAEDSRNKKARQLRPILPDDPKTFVIRDASHWDIQIVKLGGEQF